VDELIGGDVKERFVAALVCGIPLPRALGK
jgi:hypothetical protein